MKILYGITKSNFGGAQRYVFELACEADRRGDEVSVLCGGDGQLVKKLGEKNIKTITLDKLERDIAITKEVSSFIKIIQVLKKESPDVFHINSSKMGGLGALAGRISGVKKIVFTSHGWAFNEPRPWWQKIIIKFLTWWMIMWAHQTICVSEKTRLDVSSFPFVKKKLKVIHNGVKTFPLLEKGSHTFTVGAISELHRIKGLDTLLRAWAKFVKNHESKLIIIGGGEERTNLENMARNLGILDSVEFKGFIDNARSHLSYFDIFCMPSRSEAMPYSLLEAGVSGIPTIATKVGGIPEVIENGINGILVSPEDSEALFSSLVLLSEDKELRKRLGHNLKASVQESFTFESMADKTFALYKA